MGTSLPCSSIPSSALLGPIPGARAGISPRLCWHRGLPAVPDGHGCPGTAGLCPHAPGAQLHPGKPSLESSERSPGSRRGWNDQSTALLERASHSHGAAPGQDTSPGWEPRSHWGFSSGSFPSPKLGKPWLLSLLIQALLRAGSGTAWNPEQPLGSPDLSPPCAWDTPRRSRGAGQGPTAHSHQSREGSPASAGTAPTHPSLRQEKQLRVLPVESARPRGFLQVPGESCRSQRNSAGPRGIL